MSLLRDRSFFASALTHFGVDLLNSQKSLILAFLSVPLGLSNSLIGLINTLYTLSASLAQPLFGIVADHFGTRWVAAGGAIWISVFFGGAVLARGYWSLGLLVLAAMGSAAFHPAGAMEATIRGRAAANGHETTSASVFFLFGQAGLSLGPIVGGPILDQWGMAGLALLLLLVVPLGANAGFRIAPTALRDVSGGEAEPQAHRLSRRLMVVFMMLAAGRAWVQFNFITFLPKYLADLGFRPTIYGLIAGLFMGAGAAGNLAGGWLGDRFDRRWIVSGSLIGAVLPIAVYPQLGPTPWVYPLTIVAGLLVGASQSIIVVTAQNMMPSRMGAASGLVLGFMFSTASLGTLLSGAIADGFGFGVFFLSTAAISLVAGGLGRAVPAGSGA
jgi:FSR family fosmidomycin resistance protein-like MFS transporter